MTSSTSSPRKSSAASAEPTLDESTTPDATTDAPSLAEPDAAPADTATPAVAAAPVETPAPVQDGPPKNLVEVTLAHPLDKEQDLTRLRLEPKEHGYKPGDAIWVTRDDARNLVNAGYAKGIDPENEAAVEALLAPAAEQSA